MKKYFVQSEIITGEKFQNLCGVSISKSDHKRFESSTAPNSIDVDNFDFSQYDNPSLVYCNSSLFNRHKPKLVESKIIDKLNQFSNNFSLVLHNSDQNFNEDFLDLLNIDKLDKIYTQNCDITHPNFIPLPIGIANSVWPWGVPGLVAAASKYHTKKTQFIYYNFTQEGGLRPAYREDCAKIAHKLKLPESKSEPFYLYLKNLGRHKFCLCPSGNGLDTYRLWECLYLKVIPIVVDSPFIQHFSKLFPMVVLEKWEDLNLDSLESIYAQADWSNNYLLDFDQYINYIGLK